MSNLQATVLPYESASHLGRDDVYWRAFKFAAVAWSVTTVCRHVFYWCGSFTYGLSARGQMSGIIGLGVAAIECVLFTLIAVRVVSLDRATERQRLILAAMCWAVIGLSLASFLFEMFGLTLGNLRWSAIASPVFFWRVVTRLQLLIIPAMVIVATRSKHE